MKIEYIDQKVTRLEKVVKTCDIKTGSFDVSTSTVLKIQSLVEKSRIGREECIDKDE